LVVYLALNAIKLKDIPLLSIIFTIGFFIEVIGVKTGLLFGVYHYGDSLGLKWLNVPLVMGINWILLSLIGFGLVNKYFTNVIVKSSLAALLIVLLDILIEPIAIQLNYWTWQNNEIPLQNYIMWFIVSFTIQVIINYSKIKIDFKSSLLMLALQLLFFSLLNLAL
jgi:putative membrane protein